MLRSKLTCLVLAAGATGALTAAPDTPSESQAADGVTKVYVVPMLGQFGTDILPEIYEPICADIKKQKPDVIVFRLRTAALQGNEGFQDIIEGDRGGGRGGSDKTDWNLLRDLRRQFANELDGFDQMVWVENANGFISPMAFGWEDMVMSPDATIGNMYIWFQMADRSANGDNMFGKYFDAMLGTIEGVAERGGWTTQERWPLLDAMTDPRQRLSTTWVGRNALFYPDATGDFVLDNSPESPVYSLTATQAEDLLVTKGVVNDMDDVSILMGWPRYELMHDAAKEVEAHRKEWRQLLERAKGAMRAYMEGRQEGDLAGLSSALRSLKSLRGIERSNPAMPYAFQTNGIPTGNQLEALIAAVEDEIKAVRAGGRGGGRGGGGTGGGGVGPGGPRPGG